jgi:hypothetical protein
MTGTACKDRRRVSGGQELCVRQTGALCKADRSRVTGGQALRVRTGVECQEDRGFV